MFLRKNPAGHGSRKKAEELSMQQEQSTSFPNVQTLASRGLANR